MRLFGQKSANGYTIVIGCGRLGATLANEVSDKNGNVLIMDKDAGSFRKLSPSFGGLTQQGDGLDLAALADAHIENAQVLIAVTDNDNTNIMLAQIAKEVFHVNKVIVRLYDPERQTVYARSGIETICPSLLSSREIDKILVPLPQAPMVSVTSAAI